MLMRIGCFLLCGLLSNNFLQTNDSQNFQEIISDVQEDIPEADDFKNYGSATIKRISNLTSFPMFIDVPNIETSNIPDNAVLRIKSKTKNYGDKKPYIAVREEKNIEMGLTNYFLRANCYDPKDISCQFKTTNVINKFGKNAMQLSPLIFPKKFVLCDPSSNDPFAVLCGNAILGSGKDEKSLWTFEGTPDRCFFKNMASKGYLAPALLTNIAGSVQAKEYVLASAQALEEYSKNNTKKDILCCFGDVINLKSFAAFKPLTLDLTGKEPIFSLRINSAEFVVKGEHSDTDRYNAPFGKNIKNGDIVRLENTATGQNLSVSDQEIKFEKNIMWTGDLAIKDSNQHFALKLNGTNGFGDFSDNWVITFVSQDHLLEVGSKFTLQHLATQSTLVVELALANSQPLITAIRPISLDLNDQLNSTSKSLDKKKTTKAISSVSYEMEKIWFIDRIKTLTVEQKDLLRTGFIGGEAYPRLSSDQQDDNNQEFSIEVVEKQITSFIPAKSDLWKTVPLKYSSIDLSGLLEEDVPNLLPGSSLSVQPMLKKGILWCEKSLKTPNKFSVTFLAKVDDASELAIVIGDSLSDNFKYKLILGNGKNSSSTLVKRINNVPPYDEKALVNISADQCSLAKLQPGVTIPIWFVLNEGVFLAGQSDTLGENIFLAFEELGFSEQLDRIGFSCNTSPFTIANIDFGLPLQASDQGRTYEKNIKPTIAPLFSSQGFRQTDQLFANFHCTQLKQESIILGSKTHTNKYIINLDFEEGTIEISEQDYQKNTIFNLKNLELTKYAKQAGNFWINYDRGLFWGGIGTMSGKKPTFIFQSKSPITDISTVACFGGNIDIFSTNAGSYFELVDEKTNLEKTTVEQNRLVGLMPYQYSIYQQDDFVVVKDFVSKKSFFVARTPQKSADYSLILSVDTAGIPKMRWAWQPENEDLMKEKFKGRVLTAVTEGLYQASQNIEGVGIIGEVIGFAANVGVTTATLVPAIAAAKVKANITSEYLAAADQSALADEKSIKKDSSLKTKDSNSAIMNRYAVEKSLSNIKDVTPSTRELFFRVMSECKKIINLTTNAHVVGTEQLKNSFFRIVDGLYNYYGEVFDTKKQQDNNQNIDNSRQELLNTLIAACKNPYIFDQASISDVARQRKWMGWSNLLFRSLTTDQTLGQDIPPLFGDYFWLEQKLPQKGNGRVTFQAKGTGKLSIIFSDTKGLSQANNNEAYIIDIFNSESITCTCKLSSLGAPAVISTAEQLALSSIDLKTYWISVNNGLIEIGTKDSLDEEEKLASFSDPYPLGNESFVGLGTSNGYVTVNNISVSSTNVIKNVSEGEV